MNQHHADPHRQRAPRILTFALVGLFLLCSGVLLLPSLLPGLFQSPEPGRRSGCTNNLKQIGIALANYHEAYKTYPPGYLADSDGKPKHSWRVLLLPFFEDPEILALAKQYDFREPWNGPHNRLLTDKMPIVYRCPSDVENSDKANYVAVVGESTAWPAPAARRIRDLVDGTSTTISVVEVVDSDISWMEPRDLTFEQAGLGINRPGSQPGIRSRHGGGAQFLFCDGSVHYLNNEIPHDTLQKLLTATGGEEVETPE